MAQLIQDIKPIRKGKQLEALRVQRLTDSSYIQHVDMDILISELYARNITIEQIFNQYYALDAIGDHQDDEIFGDDERGQHGAAPLVKVGDVELAGLTKLPSKPIKQPF